MARADGGRGGGPAAQHGLARRAAAAAAGPALIVAGVVVLLRSILFAGRVVGGDIAIFFTPNWCFLGRSLAHGHIPTWNPFTLAGTPFASDPQSGWMYLLPMALFTALPCQAAMRTVVVALPVIAGLGLYAFLRTEGLSRPSATIGGLALGVGMSGALLVVSLPFAGTLAWTSVGLAAAARYVRATRPARMLAWAGALAAAWTQLLAAHMSIGMVVGTLTLAAYLLAAILGRRRPQHATWTGAVTALLLPVPLMAGFGLAFALPRLDYLPHTNLALGYGTLQALGQRLVGLPAGPRTLGPSASPTWLLDLSTAPALHLGAIAGLLSFAGLWRREGRRIVWAFLVVGTACYLLSLRPVANFVLHHAQSGRLADAYLRRPDWTAYGGFLALAVLAGFGVEAFLRADGARARVMMSAPGLALFGVLPLALGAGASLALFGGGLVLGAAALVLAARRDRLAWLIPVMLAAELTVNGLLGYRPLPFETAPGLVPRLPTASIALSSYLAPGPIARELVRLDRGRVLAQQGGTRVQSDALSTLFGYEEVQGYNPVELVRYWTFVRAVTPEVLLHNLSIFRTPSPLLRDLLQVRYVIDRTWPFEGPPPARLAREGRLWLFAAPAAPSLATIVGDWEMVAGSGRALAAVKAHGFDPARLAILEQGSGTPPVPSDPPGTGSARVLSRGPGPVVLDVEAGRPALVLVRIPYAPGWRATVDDRPVRVLPADYVDLAVAVSTGRHTVRLQYVDPAIGRGLAGTGISLLAFGVALAWAGRTRRWGPARETGARR